MKKNKFNAIMVLSFWIILVGLVAWRWGWWSAGWVVLACVFLSIVATNEKSKLNP